MGKPVTQRLACVLVGLTLLAPLHGFGWGKDGHQLIEVVAAELLPRTPLAELLRNNIESIKLISMVPDIYWKHGPTPHPLEAHTHFMEIDIYGVGGKPIPRDFPVLLQQFGRATILQSGSMPWRARQLSILLVKAMKAQNPIRIAQLASTLGHYYGDSSQPLHNCEDYDGRQAGVKGLHSYFETKTIQNMNQRSLHAAVKRRAMEVIQKVPPMVPPLEAAMKTSISAFKRSNTVLSLAVQNGLTEEFQKAAHPYIIEALAVSSAILARVWNDAWLLAGSPDFPTDPITNGMAMPGDIFEAPKSWIPFPDWIPLDYFH